MKGRREARAVDHDCREETRPLNACHLGHPVEGSVDEHGGRSPLIPHNCDGLGEGLVGIGAYEHGLASPMGTHEGEPAQGTAARKRGQDLRHEARAPEPGPCADEDFPRLDMDAGSLGMEPHPGSILGSRPLPESLRAPLESDRQKGGPLSFLPEHGKGGIEEAGLSRRTAGTRDEGDAPGEVAWAELAHPGPQ